MSSKKEAHLGVGGQVHQLVVHLVLDGDIHLALVCAPGGTQRLRNDEDADVVYPVADSTQPVDVLVLHGHIRCPLVCTPGGHTEHET